MPRLMAFCFCLLTAVAGNLWLENRELRRDVADMASAYDKFLASKAGKAGTIGDLVKPKSVAVLHSDKGLVACALMK